MCVCVCVCVCVCERAANVLHVLYLGVFLQCRLLLVELLHLRPIRGHCSLQPLYMARVHCCLPPLGQVHLQVGLQGEGEGRRRVGQDGSQRLSVLAVTCRYCHFHFIGEIKCVFVLLVHAFHPQGALIPS